MPNNKAPSLLEPRTILAVIAVAGIYFGWQTYLGKKYPGYGQPKPVAGKVQSPSTPAIETGATVSTKEAKLEKAKTAALTEKTFSYSNEKISFVLTSHGMGLKNVTINHYTDKEKNKIKVGMSDADSLFEMKLGTDVQALDFDVIERSPGHYVGSAQLGEMNIKRELSFDSANNAFSNTVTISNASDEILKGFSILIPEKIHVAPSTSFLFPSYEHQDFFVKNDSKYNVNFSAAKENVHQDFATTTIVAVGSQYFATAILDKSDILPSVTISSDVVEKTATAALTYKPVQVVADMVFTQVMYAGPKSVDALKQIDPALPAIIDFGFFDMISKPLVYIMKAFHSLTGNWGLAIIFLTLLVRLCVLPFNLMSMRSMKAMQKIQPKLTALREKHKKDPMTLNKETMGLMKENGANPLGGCLPMLIQIPVFFALYRVIGSSIELYQSPFFGWITDLSSHDKFYVLPVLMGVTMFFQQKLTPSTMDPMQAKVMMFLPLVFSLFMLQLPSGLTLYMFVSTLFGAIQQYLIMKEKTPAALVSA